MAKLTAAEKAVLATAKALRAARVEADRAVRYAEVARQNDLRATDLVTEAQRKVRAADHAFQAAVTELPVPPRYATGGVVLTPGEVAMGEQAVG